MMFYLKSDRKEGLGKEVRLVVLHVLNRNTSISYDYINGCLVEVQIENDMINYEVETVLSGKITRVNERPRYKCYVLEPSSVEVLGGTSVMQFLKKVHQLKWDEQLLTPFDYFNNKEFTSKEFHLVNFTESQIRPYQNGLQLKMGDKFVWLNREHYKASEYKGKFFKGVALIGVDNHPHGGAYYHAEQLFSEPYLQMKKTQTPEESLNQRFDDPDDHEYGEDPFAEEINSNREGIDEPIWYEDGLEVESEPVYENNEGGYHGNLYSFEPSPPQLVDVEVEAPAMPSDYEVGQMYENYGDLSEEVLAVFSDAEVREKCQEYQFTTTIRSILDPEDLASETKEQIVIMLERIDDLLSREASMSLLNLSKDTRNLECFVNGLTFEGKTYEVLDPFDPMYATSRNMVKLTKHHVLVHLEDLFNVQASYESMSRLKQREEIVNFPF